MSDNWSMQAAITRDSDVMHGTPVFRGTRVPVQTLFDYLENGEPLDEFLAGFPTVSRELAVQTAQEKRVREKEGAKRKRAALASRPFQSP